MRAILPGRDTAELRAIALADWTNYSESMLRVVLLRHLPAWTCRDTART
jgi:hypothetical protein